MVTYQKTKQVFNAEQDLRKENADETIDLMGKVIARLFVSRHLENFSGVNQPNRNEIIQIARNICNIVRTPIGNENLKDIINTELHAMGYVGLSINKSDGDWDFSYLQYEEKDNNV